MRFILILIFTQLAVVGTAQVKFDANWTFGHNCGLSFQDTANPMPFYSISENFESSASVSDSSGNLKFYLGNKGDWNDFYPSFYLSSNSLASTLASIKLNLSATNGVGIIPFQENKYLVIYIDYPTNPPFGTCGSLFCTELHYSVVEYVQDSIKFVKKDIKISTNPIYEKLLLVKHADGERWWLITHERPVNGGCTQRFVKFLLDKDSVIGPFYQDIGYMDCNDSQYSGEFIASSDGSKILISYAFDAIIDVLNFDRCTGNLTSLSEVNISGLYPYGMALSESNEFLYVSVASTGGPTNRQGLFQVKLDSNFNPIHIDTLFYPSNATYKVGQLEPAPNGKIYLVTGLFQNWVFPYTKRLSVIEKPDNKYPACDFKPFDLYLGDSCFTRVGLPNFPNYNLSAIGAFRMDAGLNQTICKGDSSTKGVQIGSPQVAGLNYQWLNTELDSTTRHTAQIIVKPTQSTWYYLEVSDSTATNSCTSYIDSVLVEVTVCTGINEWNLETLKVYPNPAKDKLHIAGLPKNEAATMRLFNLQGQQVLKHPVLADQAIDISALDGGLFIYLLEVDGKMLRGKVVVK